PVGFTKKRWNATVNRAEDAKKTSDRQAKETLKALQVSENAANTSQASVQVAQTQFIATHRPKIRIKHVYIPDQVWADKPIEIKLVVVNVGLTSALIREMNIEAATLTKFKRLPPRPHFSDASKRVNEMELKSGMTLALKKW